MTAAGRSHRPTVHITTLSSNCTAALLTACSRSKPVFFFYYFLHSFLPLFTFFHSPFSSLRSSILFHLSHVHQLLTFISLFLPIHFLFIGVVSCVHPFFISSCLSLFLPFHSFNRSYFHLLLYKFSAFSRFFPSFLCSYYVFSSFISCIHISLFIYDRKSLLPFSFFRY